MDPHEALLQQGFIWTISRILRIPRESSATLAWEVPEVLTHLHLNFTCDADIEVELFKVNSFSGGEVIPAFNRNSRHAQTSPPLEAVFRTGIVEEDVSSPIANGLFPLGQRVSFPTLIVSSLHQGARLINTGKDEARVWPLIFVHEHPVEKIL
jgi:hypothetical protein